MSLRFLAPLTFGIVSGVVVGLLCPFRTMREPVISVSIPFALMVFALYFQAATGGVGDLVEGLSVVFAVIFLSIQFAFTVLGIYLAIALKDRFVFD